MMIDIGCTGLIDVGCCDNVIPLPLEQLRVWRVRVTVAVVSLLSE